MFQHETGLTRLVTHLKALQYMRQTSSKYFSVANGDALQSVLPEGRLCWMRCPSKGQRIADMNLKHLC